MKFTLPDQLPATVAELDELAAAARAEINVYQARAAVAGEEFSDEDVERLEYLNASYAAVDAERAKLATSEQSHADRVSAALAGANAATTAGEAAAEVDADAEADAAAEVVAEAEAATTDAAAAPETVTAGVTRPVSFAGAVAGSGDLPEAQPGERPMGWELLPSAPNYAAGQGRVGFKELALSIDSVKPGSRLGRQKTGTRGSLALQAVGSLSRNLKTVNTPRELVEEIERATSEVPGRGKVTAEALTAAGGWQSPSVQLYDFCEVPDAVDLIDVPEIAIERGGVRWPQEPDVSALLANNTFQFFFNETQLEAVDGGGDPTAIKDFIEIPGVDEFNELRLSVVGYAVKGGILQNQGWPELTQWFLQTFAAAHLRGISYRTIQDIVTGSEGPNVIPTDAIIGATSGVLNALSLQATNLRLQKGLSRVATIEGVAPSWFLEALRADLAMRQGLDVLDVSDAMINGWLTARNIYLQYVADWQTRGSGQPGNLNTLVWPGFVDIVLYPAGTWFRALNPVITMGVGYPLQQLQLNQFTHLFTEDAIAVGKRCNHSIIVRAPLCVNGAVGARETITCSYTGASTLTKTVAVGGSVAPTGGSFPLSFSGLGGKTATIAWNSTNAQAKTALAAMDDNIAAAAFTVAGGALPGTPLVITYPAELGTLSGVPTGLTGGTGTTVTVS